MKAKNSVFIATSLDGYIADKNGGIDWLSIIPNPENDDMGYVQFMNNVDALVMGRTTFETVLGFGMEWPYTKPVFVLSTKLKEIPENLRSKVFLLHGELSDILNEVHKLGHHRLYIDGGTTIQSFLKEDLIDEMILTTIPVLLGDGIPLFGNHTDMLKFECFRSERFLDKISQNHYKRVR